MTKEFEEQLLETLKSLVVSYEELSTAQKAITQAGDNSYKELAFEVHSLGDKMTTFEERLDNNTRAIAENSKLLQQLISHLRADDSLALQKVNRLEPRLAAVERRLR